MFSRLSRYSFANFCAISVMLTVMAGCGTGKDDPVGNDGDVACQVGWYSACQCPDGRDGMRQCQTDGTPGVCSCVSAAPDGGYDTMSPGPPLVPQDASADGLVQNVDANPPDVGFSPSDPYRFRKCDFVGGTTSAVAFAPDDSFIVRATGASFVIYDGKSGAILRRIFRPELGPVTSTILSPDGRTLVGGGLPGHLNVWNVNDGSLKSSRTIAGNATLIALRFTSDSRSIVSAWSDSRVRVIDIALAGETRVLGPYPPITSIAVTHDDSVLVVGTTDLAIRRTYLATGVHLSELTGGHASGVDKVEISPNGAWLVSQASDGTRVWDVNGGWNILGLTKIQNNLVFTRDSRFLVGNESQDTAMVGVPSSLKVVSGLARTNPVLAVSADGHWAASSNEIFSIDLPIKTESNCVNGCDFPLPLLEGGGPSHRVYAGDLRSNEPDSAYLNPSGTLVSSREGVLRVSDFSRVPNISSDVFSGSWSTDGSMVVSRNGVITNGTNGQLIGAIPEPSNFAVFVPGNTEIITTGSGGVKVWKASDQTFLRTLSTQVAHWLAISNGDTATFVLALSSKEPTTVLRLSDGQVLQRLPSTSNNAAVSDDETLVAIHGDAAGFPQFYRSSDWKSIREVFTFGSILRFLPGNRLVTWDYFSPHIALWNPYSGLRIGQLLAIDRPSFTRDGLKMATGGHREPLRIWDLSVRFPSWDFVSDTPPYGSGNWGQTSPSAFTGDGDRLGPSGVVSSNGRVAAGAHVVVDLETGRRLLLAPDQRNVVALSSDGQLAVADGVEFTIVRVSDRMALRTLRTDGSSAAQFSPDDAWLVVAGLNSFTLLEVATGVQTVVAHPPFRVTQIVFAADGRSFVTAGTSSENDGTKGSIKQWHYPEMTLLRDLHVSSNDEVAIDVSRKGIIAGYISSVPGVKLWYETTGESAGETISARGQPTFSESGDRMAFGRLDLGGAEIWCRY